MGSCEHRRRRKAAPWGEKKYNGSLRGCVGLAEMGLVQGAQEPDVKAPVTPESIKRAPLVVSEQMKVDHQGFG